MVRVEPINGEFFVSDLGMGYQEADMMGASLSFSRQARVIAEEAGVGFDNRAFFIIKASQDQLAGAIIAIGNCSLEAVTIAAMKMSERKVADEADILYERLLRIFTPPRVDRNVDMRGASNTKWSVATIVRVDKKQTVFEPVINHRNSVASVATKFHDLSLLADPPERVAVVRKKEELGTLLGVLAQAGRVVNRDVSDSMIQKLARAA